MRTILTIQEIKEHYPSEWLLIDCAETDENLNVLRGEVVAHSPDRDRIYSQLADLKDRKCLAIEYGGPIPDDYAVVL